MNKWVFLALAAACFIVCTASPLKRSSAEGGTSEGAVKAPRQDVGEVPAAVEAAVVAAPAVPAAPVAPVAASEDDDDDDDDYDVGVGDDDDDDDDDDDEEEEDDDEDYFERFFDDILGDDDEDDEPIGAGSTVQAVQGPLIGTAGGSVNVAPPAAVPAAAPAAVNNNDNVVTTLEASVIPPESDAPAYDDEEEDDVTSSGAEDASVEEDDDDGRQPAVVSGVETEEVAAPAPAPAAAAGSEDEEDDDDDDEEEDLGVGDLTDVDDDEDDDDEDDEEDDEEEDDDEEDEEEGGEEDDDDDDYDTDVTSRARSLDLNGTGKVPASIYVAKYNRYVDSIIERIKKVVRKSYDPVNVRLHATTKKKNGNNNKNKTGPKRPKHASLERQLQEESLLKAQQQPAERMPAAGEERRRGGSGGGRPSGHGSRPSGHGGNNNQKPKNKGKGRPRARATLMGLSSIRREGDVSVNLMSSHTSVRSNILLGPLVLKVEKEFGRGETKDLRSASAVTEEMSGVMNLRISPEGIASLHNIRILQPKQVRVESTDDHDRTREFVWRRSSHIARLVSRKLTAAARSLLGNQKIDQKQSEESKGFAETTQVLRAERR